VNTAAVPAEPGWIVVIAREYGYHAIGDPNSPDWRIEFFDLELERLPVIAWSSSGFPYAVRDVAGYSLWLGDAWVSRIDAHYITEDGFLVGVFHPTHRPAPEDLEAYALEMATNHTRHQEQRELRKEQAA
jgi:hypothetical protein